MFVEKLSESQIQKLVQVVADDEEAKILEIKKYSTGIEVRIESMEMEENYILHDYFVESFNYAASGTEYIYRKQMLEFLGAEYANKFLLG